jgi:hypothetical protein
LPFFFAAGFAPADFVVFFETGFLAAAMEYLLSGGRRFEPVLKIASPAGKSAR